MVKRNNRKTGERGERAAGEMLGQKGYEIIAKNYRNKWGEIDIIVKKKVRDEDYVMFVEVKTKADDSYGEPWEMIDSRKLKRVENMGYLWCEEFSWGGLCRIDVVGGWLDIMGEVSKIKHWENVQL